MNRFIFAAFAIVVLAFFACEIRHSNVSCARYRNGLFRYWKHRDGKESKYSIERKDSIQTEINLLTGQKYIYRVEWKDSCTYVLNFISSTKEMTIEERRKRWNTPVPVEIVDGNENYYVFRFLTRNSGWDTMRIDPHSLDTLSTGL